MNKIMKNDKDSLDFNIINFYRNTKFKKLFKSLDTWIIIPDKDLIKDIIELSKIVKSIQPLKKNTIIYRGFDNSLLFNYQNTIGFNNETPLNTIFKRKIVEPVSFTTDIKIARLYGNNIIESFLTNKDSFLQITDEVSYIISKDYRNRDELETENEIIVFNQELELKIIEKNSNSFLKMIKSKISLENYFNQAFIKW